MDLTSILIIIIAAAFIVLVLLLVFQRKPDSKSDQAASDYAEGLNLLLMGKKEAALRKLNESVTKNSRNIDAYLKIGDILRELGQAEKAINVHKFLTVRRGLTPRKQLEILQSLAKDYQSCKQFDRALEIVHQILDQDKKNVWAQEMKVQLYEQKEEWDNAFQAYKDLTRTKSNMHNGKLALYKVQEGLSFQEKGQGKDARIRFRDAIKIAPSSPAAYIYLADSYIKENRKGDALKTLKRFVEKVPDQSFLVFERIKELLYERGIFGEIENLYLELIARHPDNISAHLALCEIYEKKGEIEKAINTCAEVLERDPSNKTARQYLVRFYHKSGKNDKAIKEALDLINESLETRQRFRCHVCGYESEEPFWRCPKCHEWDTSLRN